MQVAKPLVIYVGIDHAFLATLRTAAESLSCDVTERPAFALTTTGDVNCALEQLNDVFVLDLDEVPMPRAFLMDWRSHGTALAIIVASSSCEPSTVQAAMDCGAEAFVVKPDAQPNRLAEILQLSLSKIDRWIASAVEATNTEKECG